MTDGQYEQLQIRLHNWGRWAFGSTAGGGGAHCGSVEHRYRAPKLAEGEVASDRISLPVDMLDAELVEHAVLALRCGMARRFLVEQYVNGRARPTLERIFKIQGNLYYAYRRRSVQMLGDSIRMLTPQLIKKGKPLWAGIGRIAMGRV